MKTSFMRLSLEKKDYCQNSQPFERTVLRMRSSQQDFFFFFAESALQSNKIFNGAWDTKTQVLYGECTMFIRYSLSLVVRFECLGIKRWFGILGSEMLAFCAIKDLKFKDVILKPGDCVSSKRYVPTI